MMRAGLACGLYCAAGLAVAQSTALSDPTRPPAGFQAGAPTPAAGAGAGAPAALELQSVIAPKNGKPRALISGQVVVLGGKVGNSRLIALSEKDAVLDGPGGVERLWLTPNVEKVSVTNSMRSKGKQ